MAENMAYEVVDDVVVVVQRGDLGAEEVEELLSTAARRGQMFVWVESGTIASKERKRVADVMSEGKLRRVIIVSDDRFARGAATAVSWFGVPLKGFSLSERDRALDALEIDTATRYRITSALEGLLDHGVRSQTPQ